MSDITIRPARPEEVRPALAFVHEMFLRFVWPDLEPPASERFRTCNESEEQIQQYEVGQWRMFLALDRDRIVGIAAERDGSHIRKLFVDPAYHRQGIAAALMDAIIAAMETPRITLNSSRHGLPFYLKYGFVPTDTEQNHKGFIYTPMEYNL